MEPANLSREISELQRKLTGLNSQKQKALQEKNDVYRKIQDSIEGIKKLRVERDALTKEVKDLKDERAKLNKEMNVQISQIKELRGSQKKTSQDPVRVMNQIEALNKKIETEVITFDKEKKMMRQIKDLSKVFQECKETQELWKKTTETSGHIQKVRTEADEVHKRIQEKAQESQERHEKILKRNKEIDALRAEEKTLSDALKKVKNDIQQIAQSLEVKLTSLGQLPQRKPVVNKKKNYLLDKQRAVEEKLKKGEKLTTEDLLILQSIDE